MISYAGVCYLGWGTASLKFRQFNSAVWDALVGVLVHVLRLRYARCYTDLFYGVGVGLVSLLPRGHVCWISGVWGFYLQGGACYSYDDCLAWGLCVNLFAET